MSHSLGVLFDNAADAIFIAEKASGIILDANKAASQLLHLPHEKIVGMHQSQLHPEKDTKIFTKHQKELDRTDLTVPLEWKVVCSDGSEIPVEILASQIDYDGKQCMMGIFRDISLRKQAEQDLLQKNRDNAFLTSFSYKLADSSSKDIIKDFTLPCIKKHTNALYAHFAAYDASHNTLAIKHFEADNAFLNTIIKIGGKKIFSTSYPVDKEDYQLFMSGEIKVLHSLSELTSGVIQKKIDEAIRKVTGFEYFIGIPQIDSGNLYGITVLAFKKNQSLPSIDLLKSYSSILSISLRKNITEQNLIQSEEKFRNLLELAPEAFYHGDSEGNIIAVNEKAIELTEYSREELISMPISKLFSQDTLNENPLRHDLLQRGETITRERRIITKTGNVVLVEMKSKMMPDGRLQCFMNDITERKKAEQTLIQSEDRLESIVNESPFPIAIANDSNEKILYWSRSAKKMFGYSPEYVTEWYKLAYPDADYRKKVIKRWESYFSEAQETGRAINTGEYEITSKNGSVRICELYIQYINNNVIVSFNDITERLKSEKALKESEEKSRLLIKNSNDIIVLVNEKGEQTFVSDVVENITGYTAEELYGNILGVIHPDDVELVSQHWTEVLSNPKKPARVQYRHKHKVKGYVWLEAVAQNFFDNPSIKSVVTNIRDITNNKESETKLTKLNATKDKLFSIIAHDLRSPLNNILGFSDLFIKELQTSDNEEAKKYAAIINTSAKNNLNLVENLLTWAKTQTEEIKYKPENLELKPIVEESLMVLNTSASLKKIKLINSVSGDIVAYADPNMLKTILRNLVQNAIKFTESNGKVFINAVSNQDHIEISVTDNGVGITVENQKKLFGADLNFSMNGTENESGTGLGLMLCMEFVKKHGGKIWVESEAGKGSKFLFTLPVSMKNSK